MEQHKLYKINWFVGIGKDKDGGNIPSISVDFLKTLAYRRVAEAYSGYSGQVVDGGWWDEEKQILVEEKALEITTITSDNDPVKAENVAEFLAITFNQKVVLYEVEEVLAGGFVEGAEG